jgi:hypothetical protein
MRPAAGEVLPDTEPATSKLQSDRALTVRAHKLGVGLLDGVSESIWKQPSV